VIGPRWRKVVRDLFERRGRTALVVLALAAGVFEISAMLYKYGLLEPELHGMYGRTHPSSATLSVDRIDDTLMEAVRRVPGVGVAEARPVVLARVRVGADEWVPALLYVVRDFDHQRLDMFSHDRGDWPPGDSDVLLERTALRVAKVAVGDSITLRAVGVDDRRVRVSGTAYAPGLPPAWMEHMVPGFIAWNSPLRGGRGESAQLRITVADHPLDEGYIREVADSVRATLERAGDPVSRVTVPPPGRHPHADQMEAFLYLVLAFGALSFALSAVLVASVVQALMSEQVRQIGMMKEVGASDAQVAGIYLGQVALLALAGLVVGLPPGLLVGHAYAEFAAGILNTDIQGRPFPWWVLGVVAAVGLLVPLLAALVPVARAARITVREALADDPGPRPFGTRRGDRWLVGATWLPRPLLMSLRTTFLRRGRLALTILLLAFGGAAFLAALNVSEDWVRSVDADFASRRFDLAAGLAESQPIARLDSVLRALPEVEKIEYWSAVAPYLIGPRGVPTTTVTLLGVPSGSESLRLQLAAGRALVLGDTACAVINQAVLGQYPGLGVGDSIRMRVRSRNLALPIVGIARELAPMSIVYAPRAVVLAALGQGADSARSMRIVTRMHDDDGQRAGSARVEEALARSGIELTGIQRTRDQRKAILDHLVIIFSILIMASLVVVLVGSLALTSNLTLSVIQRTREIGVLGAIGASPGAIARNIWFEGAVLGALGWAAANLLTLPITWALEAASGQIFFKAPLPFHLSAAASAVWLVLSLLLASASSFYPARRAARIPVREALSYA
jgi:putative ABC transport system permease protein